MDFTIFESGQGRAALAIVVAVVAWAIWQQAQAQRRAKKPTGRPRALDAVDTVIGWPPEATRVLTARHHRAMEVLKRALPEHLILAQVPVSHFIKVPTRHSYVEWLRRVGHVCVDLMICDSASNVLAVVEVRQADRVDSERARKRHNRIERVLRGAGIPLHVWNDALMPDPTAVRKAFAPESVFTNLTPEPDRGPDTSPLDPVRPPASGTRVMPEADLAGRRDPPRSTWFDDLNATQPNPLDSFEVTDHDGGPFGTAPRLGTSAPGTSSGRG